MGIGPVLSALPARMLDNGVLFRIRPIAYCGSMGDMLLLAPQHGGGSLAVYARHRILDSWLDTHSILTAHFRRKCVQVRRRACPRGQQTAAARVVARDDIPRG